MTRLFAGLVLGVFLGAWLAPQQPQEPFSVTATVRSQKTYDPHGISRSAVGRAASGKGWAKACAD